MEGFGTGAAAAPPPDLAARLLPNVTLTALAAWHQPRQRGHHCYRHIAIVDGPAPSWYDIAPCDRIASLTWLDVSQNPFGDAGGEALASSIAHNRTLTALEMEANRWKGPACKPFAVALKSNDTLTRLSLAGNSVGNEVRPSSLRCWGRIACSQH